MPNRSRRTLGALARLAPMLIALLVSAISLKPAAVNASEDGDWHDATPAFDGRGAMVYHPVSSRLLQICGYQSGTTFEFPLTVGHRTWREVHVEGGPVPTTHTAAVCDAGQSRVFCAVDRSAPLHVLELGGQAAWSTVTATGSAPATVEALAFDSARMRVLVLSAGSLYALTTNASPAWSIVPISGPVPSFGLTSAIYQPGADRLLVYDENAGGAAARVWSLGLGGAATWNQFATAGTPMPAGLSAKLALDPIGSRLLVFTEPAGGYSLHALTLVGTPTWQHLSRPGVDVGTPSSGTCAYAPPIASLVVHGVGPAGNGEVDAFRLDGPPAWSRLDEGTVAPAWVSRAAKVFDPVRRRLIAYEGHHTPTVDNASTPELWQFTTDDGRWSRMYPGNTGGPPSLFGISMTYDPVRDRLLFFGGHPGTYSDAVNDTWILNLSPILAWSHEAPGSGSPDPRSFHSAAYEPGRDRLIVFGGLDNGSPTGGVNIPWALTLAPTMSWAPLTADGSLLPSSVRQGALLAHDPRRDRLMVFGGIGLNDLWTLPLAGGPWTLQQPAGLPPEVTTAAFFDVQRDRIVTVSGQGSAAEARALSLGGAPTWSTLTPTSAIVAGGVNYAATTFDATHDRFWLFPAAGFPDILSCARSLDFSEPLPPEAHCSAPFSWIPGALNPAAYAVTNPAPFDQVLSWSVSCERNWEGYPVEGSSLVGAQSTANLLLSLPVPDTAAVGLNTLVMRVVSASLPIASTCSSHAHDTTTAALASLVRLEPSRDRVELEWFVQTAPGERLQLERAPAGGSFEHIAEVEPDGAGHVRYVDRDVVTGGRYGYRLRSESWAGPVAWTEIPDVFAFALASVFPNPSRGALTARVCAPAAGRVRAQLLDVAGRTVRRRELRTAEAGWVSLQITADGDLPPGLYLARVSMAAQAASVRVVVIR